MYIEIIYEITNLTNIKSEKSQHYLAKKEPSKEKEKF